MADLLCCFDFFCYVVFPCLCSIDLVFYNFSSQNCPSDFGSIVSKFAILQRAKCSQKSRCKTWIIIYGCKILS